MSTLCTSSSTKGTLVSKVAQRQVLSFLYPIELRQRAPIRTRKALPQRCVQQPKFPSPIGLEAWFLSSLANVAHCRKHRPSLQKPCAFFTSHTWERDVVGKRSQIYGGSFQRRKHTKSPAEKAGEEELVEAHTVRKGHDLLAFYRPPLDKEDELVVRAAVDEPFAMYKPAADEEELQSQLQVNDVSEKPLVAHSPLFDGDMQQTIPQLRATPEEPLASYSLVWDGGAQENVPQPDVNSGEPPADRYFAGEDLTISKPDTASEEPLVSYSPVLDVRTARILPRSGASPEEFLDFCPSPLVGQEDQVKLYPDAKQEEDLDVYIPPAIQEMEVDLEPLVATRQELLALIDPYLDSISYEPPRRYQPSDGPYLAVSDSVQDEWPPPNQTWRGDPEINAILNRLRQVVFDLTNDPEVSYQIYRSLPAPRALYLPSKLRHHLLRHLAAVEKKDVKSMLRYLSVVDDMKVTAIPLQTSEWNSVISFAARYVTKSTEAEVEGALNAWREMEHTAGVKANATTFNILFDVATKAGKYVLAEMIHKEMDARGFAFDRYSHVGLIYFHGLRENGDGVRAAFRDLEKAGEIIDTVVLNALIYSFVRCHEASSAVAIYDFMKRKADTNPRQHKAFIVRRGSTRVFKLWANHIRKTPHSRESFQQRTPMAPDSRTYRILFSYFGAKIGDLQRVSDMLDDLMALSVNITGAHFHYLFEGFCNHGGIRYTQWTPSLLESTWTVFLEIMDQQRDDYLSNRIYINRWNALKVVTAFSKCSGKSRTLEVWEILRARWDPGDADLDFLTTNLRQLLKDAEVAEHRKDWILGF